MPKARIRAAVIGGSADDIEAAFYEALQTGNIERLMACWADEDGIVCVHPAGLRMVGQAAIRATFEEMFANSRIGAWPQQVCRIESLTSVVHNVLERIELTTPRGSQVAYVLATNVFHKTAQGWRMVVHHASPGTAADVRGADGATPVLH
ncbi:YybH family protein [Rhodoferax sp.]|uniref:YybH family protein n=1 Tax=Rhodoferax sp. TaxID=50421 RepID=UPI00275335AA|nr:nuclear transport factor 2 family protein [Rhodoferax sp.]